MKLVCVIASAVFFIVGVVPAVLGQEKADGGPDWTTMYAVKFLFPK